MRRLFTLYDSTVGKKIMMASTGVILILFIVGHMIGNLHVYEGPERYNAYAEGLRTFGMPLLSHSEALWVVRVILILSVLIHIVAATQLTLRSRSRRGIGYKKYDSGLTFSYASRTMVWGGIIILMFVIYHLMDLTWGWINPDFVPGNPYHNFVATFSVWPIAVWYIAAMIPLGLHLYHGFWSMLQTFGANNPRYNAFRRPIAAVLALIIVAGNISFPISVLTGVVK